MYIQIIFQHSKHLSILLKPQTSFKCCHISQKLLLHYYALASMPWQRIISPPAQPVLALTSRINMRSSHLRTSGPSSVSALNIATRDMRTAEASWSKPAARCGAFSEASTQLQKKNAPLPCSLAHALARTSAQFQNPQHCGKRALTS